MIIPVNRTKRKPESTNTIVTVNGKEEPTLAIIYYLNGKQVIAYYHKSDPQWRENVQTLKDQDRKFKIVYL